MTPLRNKKLTVQMGSASRSIFLSSTGTLVIEVASNGKCRCQLSDVPSATASHEAPPQSVQSQTQL